MSSFHLKPWFLNLSFIGNPKHLKPNDLDPVDGASSSSPLSFEKLRPQAPSLPVLLLYLEAQHFLRV